MSSNSNVTIRLAGSSDELAEVRSFWYRIYVEEMGRYRESADHERKRLAHPLDEGSDVLVAWAGDKVVGSVICTYCWKTPIGEYEEFYSLRTLGRDYPRGIGLATRFMLAPEYRKSPLSIELCNAIFELGAPKGIDTLMCDCNDYLLPFFTHIGFRVWRRGVTHPVYGDVTVLKFDCLDIEHLEAIGSPLLATGRRLAAQRSVA